MFNDEAVIQSWLEASLAEQTDVTLETVFIDNTADEYGSAAEALNDGASEATGDYYVFAHQDIRLLGERWLTDCLAYLDDLPDLGIAGVAGMVPHGEDHESRTRNLIYHGPEREPWVQHPALEIADPLPVQTLDELLLIVPSDVFESHQFNEGLCTGWHLYGVEYALRMNYRTSLNAYVLPLSVWHASEGQNEHGWFDADYFRTLYRVVVEYSDLDEIHTTMGSWPTSRWFALRQWLRYFIRPYFTQKLR